MAILRLFVLVYVQGKAFEELLIDAKSMPTKHRLIFRALENSIGPEYLWPQLDMLDDAINCHDVKKALGVLIDLVPDWKPS